MVKSHLFRDRVRGPEADAPYVIRQTIGILLHDLNAFIAIGLKDFCRVAGADIMPLQEDHDIADLLLLLPALFDPFYTDAANPRYFQQLLRPLFDHVQGIFAELPDDLLGVFGPNPLDQAAAQIFFHAVDCGRQCLFKGLDRELPAVFGVHFPETAQGKHTAHMYIRHFPYDRDQLLKAFGPAFDDTIAVLWILISDPFDHAPQMFQFLSLPGCDQPNLPSFFSSSALMA